MSKLKDDFLVPWHDVFGIDPQKPLRLQKRELLNTLGFRNSPAEYGLCRSSESVKITKSFALAASQGFPFVIVVSEKITTSIIPPVFIVKSADDIVWRNTKGEHATISKAEMLSVIKSFDRTTWLEFVPFLWNGQTIAGRLLYLNERVQTVELQEGVRPAEMPAHREHPTFIGTMHLFACTEEWYRECIKQLAEKGFSSYIEYETVSSICHRLRRMRDGFDQLCAIGQMPTLEFAFTGNNLLAIDIDWPTQWK